MGRRWEPFIVLAGLRQLSSLQFGDCGDQSSPLRRLCFSRFRHSLEFEREISSINIDPVLGKNGPLKALAVRFFRDRESLQHGGEAKSVYTRWLMEGDSGGSVYENQSFASYPGIACSLDFGFRGCEK
jgi:hypothetical protein